MSVKINLGAWSSVFAVPSAIVDEGLKFSDGVKLKVLLYVLRNAGKSGLSALILSVLLNRNPALLARIIPRSL